MKKKVFTVFLLLTSLIGNVQAKDKDDDGWYFGTKTGWSTFNLLTYNNSNNSITKEAKDNNANAPVFGLFLGYDFNPYIGLEIENDTTGFVPHFLFQNNKKNIHANSLQISTKMSYPITNDFKIYTRLGSMMFWDNLSSKEDLKNIFTKKSSLFPNLSLGAEYIINDKFITRLDYTWKTSIDNIINLSMKPYLGDTMLSLGWKFGASNINDMFASYIPEALNKQYVALNENINFPFNSTEIKPVAYDKLKKIDNEIKNIKSKNIYIMLSGHSDRIGNKEYNQRLSEDRAYSIKNYFTSHGISNDKITVQGMGNGYPLTDQVCKDIENRSLLISCLAPDRRVEIEVLAD